MSPEREPPPSPESDADGFFDDAEVISAYPLEQALEDGTLGAVFPQRWETLSGGKPIVATAGILESLSQAALMEIWNEFVTWHQEVMPTLPEADQLFRTTMNGETVWVLEDGVAFTILYPYEY